MVVHQPIPNSLNSPSGSHTQNLDTSHVQNPNSQHYLSLLHIPTNTISPATISSDKSLAAIFSFELKENTTIPLFSGATLEKKPITTMYMDARVDGHLIKLILDSGSAGSIITRQLMDQLADGVTKTPIGKIDDFPFEVNGIVTPIKVLVMEATQYQALVGNDWLSKANAMLDWNTQELQLTYQGQHIRVLATSYQVLWADEEHNELLSILFWDDNYQKKEKQKKELTWETDDLTEPTSSWEWEEDNKNKEKGKEKKTTQTTITYNTYTTPQQSTYHQPKLICINCGKKLSSMGACCGDNKEYSMATRFYCCPCILECFRRTKQVGKWDNQPCLACGETLLDEGIWHDIPEHGRMCDVLCQYMILISDWKQPKEAVQRLDSYPHDDDKIWQMALAKIEGTTPEKIKTIKDNPPEPLELDWHVEPIINLLDLEQFHEHYQELAPTREEQEQRSCASESESPINHNSNSDNDDNNNSSSSIQKGNDNDNDSNSDTNSDVNYEQYIALPDLSKEQELKWYSDNGEGIMPERAHDTDAGFDLRYPEKDAIKLEPHSHTCIDLKIALEILATIMVQLASRSSLVKRRINIRRGIIDVGYVRNIIAMLQNDSEKAYVIEPNEKIAQAIFLSLVRIAQLVSVEKRKELGITARGIQRFGSTGRIKVPVNMAEEKIVGQGEIISTGQAISIPPYSQYMLAIERKKKEQEQMFEVEATLCKSGEIGLINLHIPAKSYSSIKIPIYNNTGNVISILEGTTIGYLTTEIEDQPPNPIPDFSQLCRYVDITLQTIYGRDECYLLQPKQLEQMNMGNLDPLQYMQLKMLLNNFNDIFASKNEFG
ncbi:hypothetical protein G9A89_013589 [Geosiphon pyriformis]|nr:hypothetical protein G9A89_013589 [Geosiphon pyriformis]